MNKSQELIDFLAERLKVDATKIVTRHKSTYAAWARAIFCAVCHVDGVSDEAIARSVGISRGQVYYYVLRFEAFYRHNPEFRTMADAASKFYRDATR